MMHLGFLILFISATMTPGFVGETQIKTPSGYRKIAQLKVGDEIFGVNKDGYISVTTITHAISYESKELMIVAIDEEKIIVARGQKFFLPLKHVWRRAKKLHEKDVVLTAFYEALIVQRLQTLHKPIVFYEIRLKHDHAFLITKSDIVVHNCPLFSIGVLLTCGGGKIAVEAVWAGVCLFGLWLGSKVCGVSQFQNRDKDCNPAVVPGNDQMFYREAKGGCLIVPSQHVPKKSCGSSTCNPPMPGPHGTHIPSPKHGSEPKGNVAAGLNMEEGQKALDVSVPVFDNKKKLKKQRVAVWGGKYIVFEPTLPGIWHNHIRPWSTNKNGLQGLDADMQRSLAQIGLVKHGKIVKDLKK